MPRDFFKDEESVIDWSVIEAYEREDSSASWSMALAELYKLFNFLLEDQGYTNGDIEIKIRKARARFNDLQRVIEAIKIYDKIFKNYQESVNLLEVKEAEKNLKKAIKDLISESDFAPPTAWERFKASWNYYLLDKGKFYRNSLWFLSIIILIFILDNTHFGQLFIHFLASIFSSVLSWLILIGLVLTALVILVVGTIIFFGRGKR